MSGSEGRNPHDDYVTIRKELESFSKKLINKPEVIIANKMDIDGSREKLEIFKKKVNLPVYEISAINNNGLDKVINELKELVKNTEEEVLFEPETIESHVLYKFKKEQPFKIYKEGDTFVVSGNEIEKILRMTWFASDEAFVRFSKKLRKLGIDDKLKEMGIQEGDIVRILDYEFEYKD